MMALALLPVTHKYVVNMESRADKCQATIDRVWRIGEKQKFQTWLIVFTFSLSLSHLSICGFSSAPSEIILSKYGNYHVPVSFTIFKLFLIKL